MLAVSAPINEEQLGEQAEGTLLISLYSSHVVAQFTQTYTCEIETRVFSSEAGELPYGTFISHLEVLKHLRTYGQTATSLTTAHGML